MNYLAHGYRHVDRPWFLAGTALPDWLSVADRRSRLRLPEGTGNEPRPGGSDHQLLAGLRQHVADDERFHQLPAFAELEDLATARLRALHRHEPRQRSRFLAHVLVEQLLDGHLMERDAGLLDRYYDTLDALDAAELVRRATPWLSRPATGLARTLQRFRETRFLDGYGDDRTLCERLAGVARRVGLPALDRRSVREVPVLRRQVAERADELLGADPGARVAAAPTVPA